MNVSLRDRATGVRAGINRLPIRTKVLLGVGIPGAIGVLAILAIVTILLNNLLHNQVAQARDQIEDAFATDLKAKTDLAYNLVKNIDEKKGSMSVEQAKQSAEETVRNLRFGVNHKSYIWIHSLNPMSPDHPFVVMHPTLPKLEGTDVSDFRDKVRFQKISRNGQVFANDDKQVADIPETNLFVDMNRAIIASKDKSAIVKYYWPDPARDMTVGYQKMSHVRLYEPWGWVIGTGEYSDNIDAKVAEAESRLRGQVTYIQSFVFLLGFGMVGVILFIAWRVANGISAPVRMAAERMKEIAVGKLDWAMPKELDERQDEIGEMARSLEEMHGSAARELEAQKRALEEVRAIKEQIERDNAQTQLDIMGMLQVVSDASDGNLTVRAKISAGALGNVADGLNQLLESLSVLVRDVQRQVERTNQTVSAITNAARSMEGGATNQAVEVRNATQVVQKINEQSAVVSATSANAAAAAKNTEQSAAEGAQVVQNVIQGMNQLRANVQAGAKKVKALGDRSLEITSIVSSISRISEQTNMLALNAAIEAARAGEYGRGFSVVADEVRKLAERAANATQGIDRLAKSIQVETTETVEAIEQQTRAVEQQSVFVQRAGESLEKIRQVSAQSASLVGEISTAARGQVEGATVVSRTVGQISEIAQNTQKSAQGTVQTVSELQVLAQSLVQSIQRFKVS
jgi:methyl-accepting chemotaxis protein